MRGLKSDFFRNWLLHQILLVKEPHFGYFKVIQIRLCFDGNFDGFSKGTLVNQKCGAMWWPLWPILENYCLKTLTWILPLKAIALIQYQKSCNLVQGQWFCDFCSIEIFNSKKQWSHNIQNHAIVLRRLLPWTATVPGVGVNTTTSSFLVTIYYASMKREITLFYGTKKRFPYKKCPWELNWKFSSLNLASATLPPTTSLRLDNLERLS